MAQKKNLWTPETLAMGRSLIDRHATEEEFRAATGHSRLSFHSRVQTDKKRREREQRASVDPHQRLVRPLAAPSEAVEDAHRRMAAPRSITAFVFGDPPPGYSALDKRGQA